MASLNKVFLIGNITRDPELKYTPKGTAIAEFGIAVNEIWKNDAGQKQEKVTFLDLTAFGKVAEIIGEYCKKGRPVHIEGKLAVDSWDDKDTKQKRYKTKVIVENVILLGGKREEEEQSEPAPRQPAQRQVPQNSTRLMQLPKTKAPVDPDLDIQPDDSEIPF